MTLDTPSAQPGADPAEPLDAEQEEIARLLRDLERERPGSVAETDALIGEQTTN